MEFRGLGLGCRRKEGGVSTHGLEEVLQGRFRV